MWTYLMAETDAKHRDTREIGSSDERNERFSPSISILLDISDITRRAREDDTETSVQIGQRVVGMRWVRVVDM